MAAALIVVAGAGYAAYRLWSHAGALEPAVVTPRMNAQDVVHPSFRTRVRRLEEEHRPPAGRYPKLIALTFDDGPYPVATPLLLDELRRLGVPGTFFLIGRDATEWPTLARRIASDGDEVADHTQTHPDLDHESPAQVREEIRQGGRTLYRITGQRSALTLFRPPHGRYTVETLKVAQQLGYDTVLWTDDGGDWRTVTPEALADHLLQNATAPEIVLLHDGRLPTIAALAATVPRFRAAGYRFVTVSQLLEAVAPGVLGHPVKHPV